MNLNLINKIITNEKSKDLLIEIVVGGKKYTIDSLDSDFNNNDPVLRVSVQERN
jgi:hypothetical protein